MIVSRQHKVLILNLRNPERVTAVIPTAKKILFEGKELVAVPHRPDETRVLRNLGIEAPAPIEYHYQWSGNHTPFHAQRETAAFITMHDRGFVLNDMGTGKTLATLWAYDYLREIGKAHRLLVVAPLSTLERTWADTVFEHFPHLSWSILYGTREKRLKMLHQNVDIYIINHDGVRVLEEELRKRDDIDMVVIDEVAMFRNAQTSRWKSMRKIVEKKPRVWGLTGTPTPNSPTDAYGQAKLVVPHRAPPFFSAFRDQVMKQISQFKWEPRPNAPEIVANLLQPSIRFAREDCIDLPHTTFVTRHAPLTADQQKAYKDMLNNLKVEIAQGQVLAVNEAVKLMKLVQIATGVLYNDNGEELEIAAEPRIELVKEIIEQAGAKTIVFVPFKGALRYAASQLEKDFTVACVSGEVSKSARDEIFHHFQRSKHPQVLVAQPAAMSHGLTLTEANTIVWFAPITSNEVYEQANARIVRPGQTRNTLIVNIEGTPVERQIYKRLEKRQAIQGLLLDLVREADYANAA